MGLPVVEDRLLSMPERSIRVAQRQPRRLQLAVAQQGIGRRGLLSRYARQQESLQQHPVPVALRVLDRCW